MGARGPKVEEETLRRLRRFLHHPRTMPEIMEEFELSQSSAYRYMRRIADKGYRVMTSITRPTSYQIP